MNLRVCLQLPARTRRAAAATALLLLAACSVRSPTAAPPGDESLGTAPTAAASAGAGKAPVNPGTKGAPGKAGAARGSGASSGPGTTGGSGGTPGAGGGTSGSGGASGTGGSTAGGGAPVGSAVTYGRGITKDSITVGMVYPLGTDTGTSGASNTGERSIMNAIVSYYNAHGGLNGRTIKPIYYINDENSNKTYAQREQERCAVFTEDHKVFAVYPGYTTSENEAACLQKTHTLLVVTPNGANASGRFDTLSFRQFPNLYEPVTPVADRMFSAMITRLAAAKYFDKGAKIGLLYTSDAATKRAINNAMKPALARLGLKVSQEASVLSPYNLNDLAPTESQIQSAELHFAAAGITHVIIPTGLGSLISGTFMKTASAQGYKPRYGLESGSAGVETEVFSGTDLSSQLHGAVYMGWDPATDIRDVGATAPARACNAILHKAGIPDDARAQPVCDFLQALQLGLAKAPELTPSGFSAGLARAGTVAMNRTFLTDFSAGHHDGAAAVRMAHYDFACHAAGNTGCWRYDTGQIRF